MVKTAIKSGSDVSRLLKETRSLIRGFHASRRKTGSNLKRDLARNRTQARSGVKQMLSEFRAARKNAATPRDGGNGAGTALKSKGTGAEGSAVRLKVLSAVNGHPEGITMARVAESLGVAPVVLSKTLRGLVSVGMVHKDGKNYFPAAGNG
jgi:ribosomal protein L29